MAVTTIEWIGCYKSYNNCTVNPFLSSFPKRTTGQYKQLNHCKTKKNHRFPHPKRVLDVDILFNRLLINIWRVGGRPRFKFAFQTIQLNGRSVKK